MTSPRAFRAHASTRALPRLDDAPGIADDEIHDVVRASPGALMEAGHSTTVRRCLQTATADPARRTGCGTLTSQRVNV
jgi:hypothetical protein